MRECACGYTCGTDAALSRHLERALTPQCAALQQRTVSDDELFQAREDKVSSRLVRAATQGDAAALRKELSTHARSSPASLRDALEAALDGAVRAGHVSAVSVLIRHFRRSSYSRPLDGVNVVANVMNWAARGHCNGAGPALLAMLAREGHLAVCRKSALDSWQRLGLLLGKADTTQEDDDDGPFSSAGRRALQAAQRAAGPPPSSWQVPSGRKLRAALAKLEAQELVAEQLSLIGFDLDRRGWSQAEAYLFPPRFRAAVRVLLLGALRAECPLSKLPPELMSHLISVLARRVYWEVVQVAPPAVTAAGSSPAGRSSPTVDVQ